MAQIAIGELFINAITTMNEYVEEVQEVVEEIFDKLREFIEEKPYKPLYQTAKSLEEVYNEQVLQEIKKAISEWAEGSGSYVGMTERFRMGEEAKEQAQMQQDQIVEKINELPLIMAIADSRPDFTQTVMDEGSIKERLQEISKYSNKLQEIAEDKNTILEHLREENESVATIITVGITFGNSIANFITIVTNRISDFMSEELDSLVEVNGVTNETTVQGAEKFLQELEDEINQMDRIMADLFS